MEKQKNKKYKRKYEPRRANFTKDIPLNEISEKLKFSSKKWGIDFIKEIFLNESSWKFQKYCQKTMRGDNSTKEFFWNELYDMVLNNDVKVIKKR